MLPRAVMQVPEQLRPAFLAAVNEGRIRSMQNKCMPAAPLHRPGALLLGACLSRVKTCRFPHCHQCPLATWLSDALHQLWRVPDPASALGSSHDWINTATLMLPRSC